MGGGKESKGGSRETNQETVSVIQARGNGGLDQSSISKGGKKLISGYILKLEPTDFTVGLNEGCKKS